MPLGIRKYIPTAFLAFVSNLEVQRVGDPRRVIVGGQSQGCCVPLTQTGGGETQVQGGAR